MKFSSILIALSSIGAILTLTQCERNVKCLAFDNENLFLTISMFQNSDNELQFIGPFDTLTLKKKFYEFSEPYIERCGGFSDPNCDCFSYFEGTYTLNDSIFFQTELVIITPEENKVGRVNFYLNVNTFHYSIYGIDNNIDSINNSINSRIAENVTINDFQFKDALDIDVTNHNTIKRIIVKQNVGLVAFSYNDQLYVLKEE